MSSRRHLAFAILLLLAVVGLGGVLLVWPAYREASRHNRRTSLLHHKGENYDVQARRIATLTKQVEQMTRRVETELKAIPDTPDIADLMRRLSMPVDGVHVQDQTFTAGDPRDAVPGADLPVLVQPLTVEMAARFDAIFTLMRLAESMDRLLRVSSVSIAVDRTKTQDTVASATIVLESVFDPPPREVH
jgi:Tfp pilus assembly protein PilO